MKKKGILNSEISKVLSDLGHTDTIVIGDCGLPIPKGVKKIDISLKLGTPSFLEVVKEVSRDMKVEKVTIASEMSKMNPEVFDKINRIFEGVDFEEMSHEDFKKETEKSFAVIRTGECTPFANCILHSGVIF